MYLNQAKLEEVSASEFQTQKPHPWVNPSNLLSEEGYQLLVNNALDISLLHKSVGVKRTTSTGRTRTVLFIQVTSRRIE